MKRFLPNAGALVLVVALVGAVVWLRPDPPAPVPPPAVVLRYADGSTLWSSADGGPRSRLVNRVVAELGEQGLSLDRLRSGGAVVQTTIDAKAQAEAAAVVGRLVASRPGGPGAAVTAIGPESGDVRVYFAPGRDTDLAGGEPKEVAAEVLRPLTDAGAPNLVRARMSPLEVTAAYAALADGGFQRQPYFVSKVTGADGSLLYRKVVVTDIAVDQQVADRITARLKERPGCNGVACVPGAHPWTVGYTPQLAVAVFVDQAAADADLTRVVWQEFLASLAG